DAAVAAGDLEAVTPVREGAVRLREETAAAEHEAVASVAQRLAAGDGVLFAEETEAVARVLRRGDAGDACDAPAHGEDADVERMDAARPEDGEPTVAARDDLDAEATAAAGEYVAPEREGRGAAGGNVHEEPASGADAGG